MFNEAEQLILYKVANELVEDFESNYIKKMIASGYNIADVLLNFEQTNYQQREQVLEVKLVKYKNRAQRK